MHDDRPEREKYPRASIAELLGNELRAFWSHKPLVILVAFLVGGWLVLRLSEPEYLRVGLLTQGDCVYIRSADMDTEGTGGRPIGTEGATISALYGLGAQRAGCDASHSHEVALAWVLDDALVAPYPGQGTLVDRERARCEAAFEAYVGRPVEGSALDLVIAVPPPEAWDEGARAAACLVADGRGEFLQGPAAGSGR
ncbi:MAG TPA: septum formation family protein [Candidatus Limnocylindrales bacterium]|nr:septum formation family protein [Candidatus Limnocylindrales bacterium]